MCHPLPGEECFLIAGGGAPETEVDCELMLHENSLAGADAYCFKQFADAMEVLPYTLAENAGLNPIYCHRIEE